MESIVNDKCNQLQVTPDNLNLLGKSKKVWVIESLKQIYPEVRKKKTNGWGGIAIIINKQHSIQGWAASELNWSVWNVSDLSTQFYFPDMRL